MNIAFAYSVKYLWIYIYKYYSTSPNCYTEQNSVSFNILRFNVVQFFVVLGVVLNDI